MKVVQTKLEDAEYQLLRQAAKRQGLSLQDALRRAVRRSLFDPEHPRRPPLGDAFPLPAGHHDAPDDLARQHDHHLYDQP